MWKDRAEVWDAHILVQESLEWGERRKTLRAQDWTLGEELRERAQQLLAQMPRFFRTQTQTHMGADGVQHEVTVVEMLIRPHEIIAMAKVASELQRLASGEPTSRPDITTGGQPIGRVAVVLPDNMRGDAKVDKGE